MLGIVFTTHYEQYVGLQFYITKWTGMGVYLSLPNIKLDMANIPGS